MALPPVITLNTQSLLSPTGVQWFVDTTSPSSGYGFVLAIQDTQVYATYCSLYRRKSGQDWVKHSDHAIWKGDNGVALVPEASRGDNWLAYALIPTTMGRNGRLINVIQFNF